MIELESWARPFFNLVVSVLHAEANQLHPDHKSMHQINWDLNDDGLYVTAQLHQKLKEAMAAAGYQTSYADDIDVSYDAAADNPNRGLMHTVSEDEPGMYVWMFFNHNV